MVGMVDTTILVDIMRYHQPALTWFQQQAILGVCPISYLELLEGCPNKNKQQQALILLGSLKMVYLEHVDMDWAIEQHRFYRLSHGLGMMDCLIASVNMRLNLPLFTGNLKHFAPLLGALAQRPY
jgi:predicted nucleic acid-binding protein